MALNSLCSADVPFWCLRFSSDADIVRLTKAYIIIIVKQLLTRSLTLDYRSQGQVTPVIFTLFVEQFSYFQTNA